ncbi:hypothetical protein Tco_0001944 [Tanacetum coccineum]
MLEVRTEVVQCEFMVKHKPIIVTNIMVSALSTENVLDQSDFWIQTTSGQDANYVSPENGAVWLRTVIVYCRQTSGPSYDLNTPFEVQDHDTCVDHLDEYHEVHKMQNDVQHNYVVDSDAEYASASNIILYNQYIEDNKEHVVQSNVSSV